MHACCVQRTIRDHVRYCVCHFGIARSIYPMRINEHDHQIYLAIKLTYYTLSFQCGNLTARFVDGIRSAHRGEKYLSFPLNGPMQLDMRVAMPSFAFPRLRPVLSHGA